MQYVDVEQVEALLLFLERLPERSVPVVSQWRDGDIVLEAALERVAHLGLEAVTDLGSLMIDGFILRDAGSYGDIVAILAEEQIIDGERKDYFLRLVQQRKQLVQDYLHVDHSELLQLAREFPVMLPVFVEGIRHFIAKEQNPAGE